MSFATESSKSKLPQLIGFLAVCAIGAGIVTKVFMHLW